MDPTQKCFHSIKNSLFFIAKAIEGEVEMLQNENIEATKFMEQK